MNRRGLLAAVLGIAVAGALLATRDSPPPGRAAPISTSALMAETAPEAAFARAVEPRPFEFPRDHGPHPAFRTEWWYFTGHLRDADAREYGFQVTLFRFEIDDRRDASPSAWRTPRVFLGHFALTDVAAGEFHAFERMSRALPGIAVASAEPPRVQLDDWVVRHDPATGHWHVHAAQAGVSVTLELAPRQDPIAQGDGGLSQKSAAAGNASLYYSVPRLSVDGEVRIGEHARQVSGQAWLDREWSTSALDREQSGWDWYAIQFEDGASLMYYRLRRGDDATDPHSAGTFVDREGAVTRLGAADVSLTPRSFWTSPVTGARYPARTRLEAPGLGLDVDVAPRVPDQEWRERFRYWEGAATVSGSLGNRKASGLAYVELTGY